MTAIDTEPVSGTFEAFYREQLPGLARLAHLLGGSPSSAEDLAQDALVATHARWEHIENPGAYARRALVNLVRSQQRRLIREQRHDRRSRRPVAVLPPELDETWTAIRALPADQRAVLVLRFYEDMQVATIAAVLDKPEGTVKSLIHRALGRLKETL